MSNNDVEVIRLLEWLVKNKPYFETLYFISSIGLVTSLAIGLRQLNLFKKDMKDRNRRASMEKSVEYLTLYATRFLPAKLEYNTKFAAEVPKPLDTSYLYDGKFNIPLSVLDKQIMVELIIKQKCGINGLFNELEFFSVAILEGLAIDEIIYTPVAKSFCRFIKEEHLMLAVSRNRGTPFKNLVKLYQKWSDRLDVEQFELQKLEAEHKIKQKGDGYKSIPPIGID